MAGVNNDPTDRKGAATMNTIVNTIIVSTNSCQPHRQEELTESELCNVSGGGSKTGAGKVTFNPFSITKHIDVASPKLF
jgi:type VI protein secretion system component Hcp